MSTPTTDQPAVSETRTRYLRDGYLVVKDALARVEIDQLTTEAIRICRGELGAISGAPRLSGEETDDELMQRFLCIHHPHKISRVVADYLAHPAITDVLTQVIGPNVKCMQAMLFIKSAGKPGQAWHQDEDFIPTRDRSLIGAWIALDDATTENGCLWVIPGSHRHGVLWELREQRDEQFDCADEAVGFPYSDEEAIPVEVTAGSIVFFNGYLLHRSLPNRASSGYRRALVNHYMSAESLLPWRAGVDATADFRDILMVAGTDPYAYKGFESRLTTHIRPDGSGGCEWPEGS